jgi:integrase
MTTFADQSVEYMRGLRMNRKQRRLGTLDAYQSYLDAHLLPQIGSRALSDLDNAAAKAFFRPISDKLAASTVKGIFNVFKGVIASAVDSNGNQIYPQTWNKPFLELPKLSPADQNTPVIAEKTLQEAFLGGSTEDRLLWALLAGSGLRIGEALAVHTHPNGLGNYWNPANRTIIIEVQRHEAGDLGPVKTAAGRRIVDLCPSLNGFLLKAAPSEGFLITSREGAARKRFNKVIPNIGFHAFRRFRLTQVAVKSTPTELDYFWAGHAAKDVHQRYVKWISRIDERHEWAERVGLGFELPQ